MNWTVAQHLNLHRTLDCGCIIDILDWDGAVYHITWHDEADVEHKIKLITQFRIQLLDEIRTIHLRGTLNA